jgi:hypothetical protein
MASSTTRRAKVNQTTLKQVVSGGTSRLQLKSLKGIATPVNSKTENVTIRLSGAWLELWKQIKEELPELSDSEILRQSISLRAALVAVDTVGNRPRALLEFIDETGETVQVDLEQHVGISKVE